MHQSISEVVYNLHLLTNLGDDEAGGMLLVDTYTVDPGLNIGDVVKIVDWRIGKTSSSSVENLSFSFDARVMDIQKVILRRKSFVVNIVLESPDREVVVQLRDFIRAGNPEQFSS